MPGPTTRLRLRVTPRASRPGVGGRHGETWRIRVSSPPEGGRANAAVLALLSGVAVERHGQTAVVRALSRPQRAPAHVSAFGG